jgi:tetratricopeptide (TPR) repeat protein
MIEHACDDCAFVLGHDHRSSSSRLQGADLNVLELDAECNNVEPNMTDELQHLLRTLLLAGIQKSRQSSYGRRAPAPASLPDLNEARVGLKRPAATAPENPDVWRLLAQAEECFLNYAEARRCLEQAIHLSKSRKQADLKRLTLYKAMGRQWGGLRLSAVQLRNLGDYLRTKLQVAPRTSSFQWTETWLREQGFSDIPNVLESLRQQGAYDDFQVLGNLVRG